MLWRLRLRWESTFTVALMGRLGGIAAARSQLQDCVLATRACLSQWDVRL